MFDVVGQIPEKISVVLADINDTLITQDRNLGRALADLISGTVNQGTRWVFIGGGEIFRVFDRVIVPLKQAGAQIKDRVFLYAEYGAIRLNMDKADRLASKRPTEAFHIREDLKDHPILEVQRKFASLFWQIEELSSMKREVSERGFEGTDDLGRRWFFPQESKVVFPECIYNERKFVIPTAEIIRDLDGKIPMARHERCEQGIKIIRELLRFWGIEKESHVFLEPTAIVVFPKIDNVLFSKAFPAGEILVEIAATKGIALETLFSETIVLGNAWPDLAMTKPAIPLGLVKGKRWLPFVFVGGVSQRPSLTNGRVAVLPKEGFQGPELCLAVLETFDKQRRFGALG